MRKVEYDVEGISDIGNNKKVIKIVMSIKLGK